MPWVRSSYGTHRRNSAIAGTSETFGESGMTQTTVKITGRVGGPVAY